MAFIYAMSDIHGVSNALAESLNLVNLSCADSKLIFCGDYIDYGPDSSKSLYKVKEWSEKHPNQVYVLMGNHEQMFLDFLRAAPNDIWNSEWLGSDKELKTVRSFVAQGTMNQIASLRQSNSDNYSFLTESSKVIKADILNNHSGLIKWLKSLAYFHETECQIFVHAGVDEDAEEYWQFGTPDDFFVSKYPATLGKFHKDIIAGHIGTSTLKGDKDFHDVFWDGKSHLFIDGTTVDSGIIPVLKYDTITKSYSSFKRATDENSAFSWVEYTIKGRKEE